MERREYTYEEYKKAMDMYKNGIGPTEISRKTGIKKCTIEDWIYRGKIPWLAKWIPEPSNELAYVLGVLYGDGYTVKEHHHNYDIELLVKDYEFAETFSKTMSKLLNKKYMKPVIWKKGRRNLIRVYYRSKAFYMWYKKQNLESLKQYIEYSKETLVNFLRGLYDSEGTNYRCKQIYLSNNDIDLLEYVQHLLRKYFSIKATGPYLKTKAGSISKKGIKANHNTYSITIYRKDSIQRFLSEVGFSISEKQLGLPRR